MTEWAQITGASGWTQWADIGQADQWVAVAAAWLDPSQTGAVANDPAGQVKLVQSATTALGNAFRSLNLPPLASPEYRITWFNYFGPVSCVNDSDVEKQVQRSLFVGGGVIGARELPAVKSSDQAQAVAQCALIGQGIVLDHLDETGGLWIEPAFVSPNQVQGVWTWNVLTNSRPGFSDWGTIGWQAGPNSNGFGTPVPGAAQSQAPCGVTILFYPYVWQLDFLRDIVSQWQAVGSAQWLEDARNFTTALNASNALALGILPAALQAGAQALAGTLNAWLSNPDSPPRAAMRNQALAMAAQWVAVAPPPYGEIIGGIIALAGIIASVALPIAVGVYTDPFGRGLQDARMTSAWQPAQIVQNRDNSAPTDAQLAIGDPIDGLPQALQQLARAAQQQAQNQQAQNNPAPVSSGASAGTSNATVLNLPSSQLAGATALGATFGPAATTSVTATGTPGAPSIVPTGTPVDDGGVYRGTLDNAPIAAQTGTAPTTTTTPATTTTAAGAPTAPASTLTSLIQNPAVVSGGTIGIGLLGWGIQQLRNRE